MKGTEKQVKWANDILKKTWIFKDIPEELKKLKFEETSCKNIERFKEGKETINIIYNKIIENSTMIIENRKKLDDERFLFDIFDSLNIDRNKAFSRVLNAIYKKKNREDF